MLLFYGCTKYQAINIIYPRDKEIELLDYKKLYFHWSRIKNCTYYKIIINSWGMNIISVDTNNLLNEKSECVEIKLFTSEKIFTNYYYATNLNVDPYTFYKRLLYFQVYAYNRKNKIVGKTDEIYEFYIENPRKK